MSKTRNNTQLEKRDAMDLLDIHDDISVVHMLTGIHQRTLRRWRKKTAPPTKCNFVRKRFFFVRETDKVGQSSNHAPTSRRPRKKPTRLLPPAGAANAEAEQANENFQTLLHIRDQLLRVSRQLVDILDPRDPDINLQTMALSRILERAHWLDETLYPSDEVEMNPT